MTEQERQATDQFFRGLRRDSIYPTIANVSLLWMCVFVQVFLQIHWSFIMITLFFAIGGYFILLDLVRDYRELWLIVYQPKLDKWGFINGE